MPNDIIVTKNTTPGSERWDVTYTADKGGSIDKTLLTAGTLLDRNIKVAITTPTQTLPTTTSSSSSGTSKASVTPGTSNKYINIPTGFNAAAAYYTINGDANLLQGNIKQGVTIFGVEGTYSGQGITLQSKTISPTESQQIVTADTGYDALSQVTVEAISSTYVGSEITRRSSTDLTVSGATITAPAGYYESGASKSVSTMTLPTSASSTSSGTSKATISRSTSDQYINIPTGYNTAAAYYKVNAVANGSVTAPSTISGSSATVSTGTNTLTLSKTVSVTPNVTTAGYISSGTAGNSAVSLTASVTTKGATTYHPSTTAQSITSGTYLTGAQTINAVTTSNLIAANIKDGTTVKIGDSSDDDCVTSVTGTFTDASTVSTGQTAAAAGQILSGYSAWVDGAEVQGNIATVAVSTPTVSIAASYTPARIVSTNTQSAGYTAGGTTSNYIEAGKLASTTYTPTTSDQTIANSGLYLVMGTGGLKVAGDANLVASKIKDGVSIFGVSGTFTDSSTVSTGQTAATSSQILDGYSAWVDGAEVQGSIATKTSSDLSVSGATVTASAGYYASSASASVASMTLPTSTSTTSSGTNKATIGRSTSTRYINIPTGYNSSAAYYTISAVPNGSATGPSSLSASSATVTTGTNTITLTKTGVTTTPTVSAGYVSSATASTATVALTASVTTKGATTYTPTTTDQTIASGTYLTGTQTIVGDADLVAGNIKKDVTIFGVTGTFEGAAELPPANGVDF